MKHLRYLAAALLGGCCLLACAKPQADLPPGDLGQPMPPEGADASPVDADSSLAGKRIAVVPKSVTHQFWTTVKAGAEAAGAAEGIEVLWKGPDAETDIAGQIAMLEDFITQRVDAIVMAACDADALVGVVQQAESAGIPVVTIDSGVNWDGVRCFVATDNVAAARTAGEELIQRIGGQGKVGCIPFVKGADSSEKREQGFREAVEAAPGVELVATLYSDSDPGKGKDVTNDMLTRFPDLAGIFAANEAGAIGAANAIAESAGADGVVLVGFDGSPDQIRMLRDGHIAALVVQNPFKMGFEGVSQAIRALRGETLEKRVDTGVLVVTADNVDTPEVQQVVNPQ